MCFAKVNLPVANLIVLGLFVLTLLIQGQRPSSASEREPGTDRPGLDYRNFALTVPLPDRCEAACNEDAKCRAWTFAWPGRKGPTAHCFLKSGLPPKKPDNCCISGVRSAPATADKPTKVPGSQDPTHVREPDPRTPPQKTLADACDEYARTAVEQNRQNEELFCSLSGSRWGYDYEIYLNWCMTKSTAASRQRNTEARDQELSECRRYFGIPDPTPEPRQQRDLARENACREYANRSVEQVDEARELGCRFTGSRWASGFQRHFSWCMSVSKSYLTSEILERNTALESCRPRQLGDNQCEQYARTAFRLARSNFERRCGFTGPRWRRDVDAHLQWCNSAADNEREAEQQARHRALAACTGGPRVIGTCARYAQAAVKHALDNTQRGCGETGSRWRSDYESQFVWCMNAKPQQRFRERRARMRALLKCRGTARFDFNAGLKLYRYRWDELSAAGSGWATDWVTTGSRAICQHKREGCRCGWQNYCGDYRTGEIALWWRSGCQRNPIQIRCTVEER